MVTLATTGDVLSPHALEAGDGVEHRNGGALGHVQVVGDVLVDSVAEDAMCVVSNSGVALVEGWWSSGHSGCHQTSVQFRGSSCE